jgi:hypothetical protein
MASFTDRNGKDWTIKVNPSTLARVEDRLGVDFATDPEDDGGPIIRIATDCMFCFRVLWVLCESQADERSVTSEEFGDALVGDALGKAQRALCDAIVAFYPSESRRKAVARVFEVIQQAEDKIVKKASESLDALSVDAIVSEVMNAT